MDRFVEFLTCVALRTGVMAGIILIEMVVVALFASLLALVGLATAVTIPQIWALAAAAFGVAVAAILAWNLATCLWEVFVQPGLAQGGEPAGVNAAESAGETSAALEHEASSSSKTVASFEPVNAKATVPLVTAQLVLVLLIVKVVDWL